MLIQNSSSPCRSLISSFVLAVVSSGACAGEDDGFQDDSFQDDAALLGSVAEPLLDCSPGAGQVAFFADANFVGACSVLDAGDYANAGALGIPNDSASSVRVGAGAQVILCRDDRFGGDCIRLTTSSNVLSGTRVGNDALSSARVQALGTQECAPGPTQSPPPASRRQRPAR